MKRHRILFSVTLNGDRETFASQPIYLNTKELATFDVQKINVYKGEEGEELFLKSLWVMREKDS